MQLHVTLLGHGPQALLAFHGIGQTGEGCFKQMAAQLGHLYTIYACDLPFHGLSSTFTEEEVIKKSALSSYIQSFLQEQQIDRFSIIGFSIGGRFAISVAESFLSRIDEVFLLAPDGIYPHPMYRLATSNFLTRKIFKWVMLHPSILLTLTRVLTKNNLYPSALLTFLNKMFETPEKSMQVYNAWTSFRNLSYNSEKWLDHSHLHLKIFLAQYDFLIPPSLFISFKSPISSTEIKTFKVSHFGLVNQVANFLIQERK